MAPVNICFEKEEWVVNLWLTKVEADLIRVLAIVA